MGRSGYGEEMDIEYKSQAYPEIALCGELVLYSVIIIREPAILVNVLPSAALRLSMPLLKSLGHSAIV